MDVIDQIGLILTLGACVFLLLAYREKTRNLTLSHFVTLPDEELPSLSIVVAAKDEQETIGAALDSLLALDYPDLEIILVDDRSEDETLQIAREKAAAHPRGERLTLIANRELPQGWLGKVHGLHLGVKASSKDLVLLTDADVVFESGSLKRALSAQKVLACDHLVVAPQIVTKGFWEPLLVGFFLIMFAVRFRPNRVHRDKKSYVGIGAFNLLTRSALQACGQLEPLRLQVTDDVHLGRLVKSQGMSQYCLVAEDRIKVRWFEGLWGCISGLEKNAYAGMNYSLPFALMGVLFVATPLWLPFTLTCLGYSHWALVYIGFTILLGLSIPDSCLLPKWVAFLFPLASLVLTLTFARSVVLAESRRGIVWRNTHYELEALRKEHWRFLREVAPI